IYSEVATRDPQNVEAHAGAGFAFARQGKLERAEEEFKTAGSLGPAGARIASEGLADVALARDDLDGADRTVRRAGDDGYAHVVRGEIAARRGRLPEAEREFQIGSARQGRFAWQTAVAFNNLARVYRTQGNRER